jgi:hypothetical protein
MIGLILNCRGAGKKGISFHLRDLIGEYEFDFIGLQETMKKHVDASMWRKFDVDNIYNWLWSTSVGRSRGILCGIKSSRFKVLSIWVGRYFVKAKVFDNLRKIECWLIIVYGAAQNENKEEFLQDLSNIYENLEIPSFIGGDFNILRFADEKNKEVGRSLFLINSVRLLINSI